MNQYVIDARIKDGYLSLKDLPFKEETEVKFCKVYEGILFNTIIPHRGDREGLYKLTVKGKSVLNSGRN